MSKHGWAVQYIPVALTGGGACSVYELSKYMDVKSVSGWLDALTLLVHNPSYVYDGGILGVSLLCAPTMLPTGISWLLYNTFLSRREIRDNFSFAPPLKFQEEWRNRVMSATELMRPIRAQNITTSVLSKIPTVPAISEKKKQGYRVNGGNTSSDAPIIENATVPNDIFAEQDLTWDLDDAIDVKADTDNNAVEPHISTQIPINTIPLDKKTVSEHIYDGPLDVEDDVFDKHNTEDPLEVMAPKDARDMLKDAALKMQQDNNTHTKPSTVSLPEPIVSTHSAEIVSDEDIASDVFEDQEVQDVAQGVDNSSSMMTPTMLDDKSKERTWSQPNWDFDGLEDAPQLEDNDSVQGDVDNKDIEQYSLDEDTVTPERAPPAPLPVKKTEDMKMPAVTSSSASGVDKVEKTSLFSRILSPIFGKPKLKEVSTDKISVENTISFEDGLDHRILEWYTLWVQTPGNTANGQEKPQKLVEEGANIAALMNEAADQRLSDAHGLRGMMIKQALVAAKRAYKQTHGVVVQSNYDNVVTREEREEDIRGFDNEVDDEARVLIRPLSSDPEGPMNIEDDLDEEEEKLSHKADTLYDGVVNEDVKNQDPDDLYRKLSSEEYATTVSEGDVKISELLPKPIRSAEAEGKLHEMQRQRSDEWERRLTLDDDSDKDDIIPFATSIAPEDNKGPVEIDAETAEAYMDSDESVASLPWSRKVLAPLHITPYIVNISNIYGVSVVLSPVHLLAGEVHTVSSFLVDITKEEEDVASISVLMRSPMDVVMELDTTVDVSPQDEVEFSDVVVDDVVVSPMMLVHTINPMRVLLEKEVNVSVSMSNNILNDEEDDALPVTFIQGSKLLIDNYIDNIFPAYRDWLDTVSFINSVGQVEDMSLGSRQIIFRYQMADGGRGRLQADIMLGSWKGSPPLENGTMGLVVLLFIDVPEGNWKLLKNVDNLTPVADNPFVDRWVLMNGDKVIPVRDGLFESMAMGANDLGRRLSIIVQFMMHDGAQVTWEGPTHLDMGGLGHQIIWSKGAYFPADHSDELRDMLKFTP